MIIKTQLNIGEITTNNCGCGCYGNKNFLILDGKKTTLEINKKSEKKMI